MHVPHVLTRNVPVSNVSVFVPQTNICLFLQLEGEPEQIFHRMLVLDGNNSLKRMKSTRGQQEVGDTRELQDSDYFLDKAYVNSFEDEVHRPAQTPIKQEPEDVAIDEDEGYITEADEPQLENCASNWKAAASVEKK